MDGATAYYEDASPSLLAQQPPTNKEAAIQIQAGWPALFRHLESRMGGLRSRRTSWWTHWSALARYLLPRRFNWLTTANQLRGGQVNDNIIDSTATKALETCAAGLWSGLTSPSRPWFNLEIGLPWVKLDAEGKEWLEDTQERVYTVLSGSNFYTETAQMFQDVAGFGTAPLICYEDFEDIVRFYLPVCGEYYLANGARKTVDVLYRDFIYSTSELVEFFGYVNCPGEVQEAFMQGRAQLDREWVVCHAVEPNTRVMDGRAQTKQMLSDKFAFREVYWVKGVQSTQPLSIKGFQERPFAVARWSKAGNDPYGRSPGMDALGDTKQIQVETIRKAEYIEKGIRPPMGADPDLKNEPYSILPGMITFMQSNGQKKGFWPLFEVNPVWLNAIMQDIKDVCQRIKDCFYVNVFMAITNMEGVQPRNELELTKRDLERLQQLGPMIELFEQETAGPLLRRVMHIMQRRGVLSPMPESLKGVPLKISYTSILRMAQKSTEAVGMQGFFQVLGGLSSAAKAAGVPDPIRIVDLDKATRRFAVVSNFASDLLFTEEEVQTHDQARTQAQQAAKAPGEAMAAVTAAKTLSQADLTPGNALSALVGQQQ